MAVEVENGITLLVERYLVPGDACKLADVADRQAAPIGESVLLAFGSSMNASLHRV